MLAIDPPAGFFVHSQIARISVARTGARTMMREADLAAMDRIIRPTGELDPSPLRAPAAANAASPARDEAPVEAEGKLSCLQILEKPQNRNWNQLMVRFAILPRLEPRVSVHFHDLAIRISAQLGGRRKPFVE